MSWDVDNANESQHVGQRTTEEKDASEIRKKERKWKRERSDKVERGHNSQLKWSMWERLKFMPVTGAKQWNIKSKANTQFGCQIPTEASWEAEPRTKTISDSLRDTVSVYGCLSLRFTWMKFIWKPQVATHKRESTRLPLHLSHIKGIYSTDHEFLFDSIQLFLSLRFTELRQSCSEEVCINWRAWQQWWKETYSAWEEFVSLSNGLASYSILPSRRHLLSVLASCFTNSHCYSLTQMRQRLGEAEERCYEGTEGSRKKERNTVSCWGLKKRREKKRRQARVNSSIEKGEQLLPQTPIHTPTSPPRNPQIPSSPPFSPPSPH